MTNQYPFGALPKRRLILVGKGKPGAIKAQLVRLAATAEIKRGNLTDVCGSPSETRCSDSLLEKIREARDAQEAAKLKAVPR